MKARLFNVFKQTVATTTMTTTLDTLALCTLIWGGILLTILTISYIHITYLPPLDTINAHHRQQTSIHTVHLITLDARIGCPTGYCYLPMIIRSKQTQICQRFGPFPTIRQLLTIPKSSRTHRRGTLEFIADGLLHFTEDARGDYIWKILEYAGTQNAIITSRIYTKLDCPFPDGFRYLQLIHPNHQLFVGRSYGPNPSILLLNITPSNYRASVRGTICESKPNSLRFIYDRGGIDVWHQVCIWARRNPDATIGM